jgi:16S rRNA (uracil1498-N3)-methyltransferase
MVDGDVFRIIDDRGEEHEVEITSLAGREIVGRVHRSFPRQTDPRLTLTVIHAVPKGRKLDTVIQKCAELGVRALLPVISERTIPRLDDLRREKRLRRWQKISEQATEQSGRASVMSVTEIVSLPEALSSYEEPGLKLMMHEGTSDDLRRHLEGRSFASATIAVGPEGGFSPREVSLASDHGYLPASLGPRILRTETVAPVVAAILFYICGDL